MVERGWTSLAMTNWAGAWRGTDFSPVVIKKDETKLGEADEHINGQTTAPQEAQVNCETVPNGSATGKASIEPAGTAEGALRMEPEIMTAQPIVLGHALQRKIKICRCKLWSILPNVQMLTL